MNSKLLIGAAAILVLVFGFFAVRKSAEKDTEGVADYKSGTYEIDGKKVALKDGVSETQTPDASTSKTVVRYFGNEARGDFNADGREDVAFLLTENSGGSGTFFYLAAALRADSGYRETNTVFLGDRIAPQTTEVRSGAIVVNYTDRKPDEPMTASPSVGVSRYFQIINGRLTEVSEGVVVSDGEDGIVCTADAKMCPDGSYIGRIGPRCEFAPCPGSGFVKKDGSGITGTVWLGPICPVERFPPDPNCADKPRQTELVVLDSGGENVLKFFSSGKDGSFSVEIAPGKYLIRSSKAGLPNCSSNDVIMVEKDFYTKADVFCDSGIR